MQRPRLKLAHRPILLPGDRVWIGSGHHGLGSEISGAHAALTWEVCQAMDGSMTRDELVEAVARSRAADRSTIERIMEFLITSGWVEDAEAPVPPILTQRDTERYRSSAQLLSWIDQVPRSGPYELQARLKASRVTVLGLGGIGSAVATSLAASGIGHLHLVDGDVVELSNLNRQALYAEADIGQSKADTAIRRLSALNSDIEIGGSDLFLKDPADIRREVAGCDIFVHCVDRPDDIYYWSNQVSLELGIPWILSSYAGPMAAIGTFIPGETGCFRCIMDAEESRADTENTTAWLEWHRPDGYNPVMAPTAQVSGHLAAMEAIYFLLGMKVQTAGRQLHHDFLDYEHQYYLGLGYSGECPHVAKAATESLPLP
jgi:molybdopterin-synthase adenylyltransferase